MVPSVSPIGVPLTFKQSLPTFPLIIHPFFCYLFKDHNSAEMGVGEKASKMEMVKIKSELLRDNTKLYWVPTGLPG